MVVFTLCSFGFPKTLNGYMEHFNTRINSNSNGYHGNIFIEFAILGISIRLVILTNMSF